MTHADEADGATTSHVVGITKDTNGTNGGQWFEEMRYGARSSHLFTPLLHIL